MKHLKINFIISFLFIISSITLAQQIEIKYDWLYLNGEKFFVKGIGYETHTRPGQLPWVYQFDPDILRSDFEKIKSAGFNTIRTWGALTEEELELVEESGLKIIFGIWIDPKGNYGDPDFIQNAENHIRTVLSYSKHYSSVITYIIMNEPLADDIYNAGAENLSALWQRIKSIINTEHPGIPVTISNTIVGDYIGTHFWDITAYNIYIYNPVTVSSTLGYKGIVETLRNNRSADKPMIVTEFGLSVSPGTPVKYFDYGKNSLSRQAEGSILMYRGLIDGGAQGGCVFQFHDGWWKAGNENFHDPDPEEWFGLHAFENGNLVERPVWQSFSDYNKAIITSPKNEEIYTGIIPLEIFPAEDVTHFEILYEKNKVFESEFNTNCFNDDLHLNLNENIKDVKLNFVFFNDVNDTVKTETISLLYTREIINTLSITVDVFPETLVSSSTTAININLDDSNIFSLTDNKVNYAFHPHIGFDEGITYEKQLDTSKSQNSFTDNIYIPANSRVATFSCGASIKFGGFTKRIHNWKILLNGNWADPIADKKLITGIKEKFLNTDIPLNFELSQNFPNPFNPSTTIEFEIPRSGFVKLELYNSLGELCDLLVDEHTEAGKYKINYNAENISSGIYLYRLSCDGLTTSKKMVVVK